MTYLYKVQEWASAFSPFPPLSHGLSRFSGLMSRWITWEHQTWKTIEGYRRWKLHLSSSHLNPFESLEASNSVQFQPSQERMGTTLRTKTDIWQIPSFYLFLMFQRWILSRISQQRPHRFSRTGHIMSMAIFNGSRLRRMAVHDDLNVEQMKPVELFTTTTKSWWSRLLLNPSKKLCCLLKEGRSDARKH